MTGKYYPALLEYKQAGNNRYFVLNRNDETTHIISRLEADLLSNLSGCRTLELHLRRIKETDRYNLADSALLNNVKEWINKGFLRNEKLIMLADLKKNEEKIKTISGCITFNRPDMIDRWLSSRIITSEYKERKIPIIICDDSKEAEIITNNKKIINKHNKNYPVKITLITNSEKNKFADLISQNVSRDIPENLVQFGMALNNNLYSKNTRGGNRNTLTLASAGFNLYSSDDDIEYSFFSRQNLAPDIYHFSDDFNSPVTFYPDIKTLLQSNEEKKDINLIDRFESYIDLNTSELLKNKDTVFSENLSPESAMLMEKRQLKIRAVGAGYCGGRWYQNPYMSLFQQDKERDLFFNDYEKYKLIRDNGLNIKSADSNIIHKNSYLMGGTFYIDNKQLLSPCLPQGRRDDTNFAIILNKCLDPGFILHLPFALYHNPENKAPFKENHFSEVSLESGVYSTLILEKLTNLFTHTGGKQRLSELGFRLQEIGSFNSSDFEEYLKLFQLGFLTKIISNIHNLFELYNEEPSWWAEDMRKYCSLLKKEALSSESVVPRDLRVYQSKNEALSVYKNYLYRCGEMLQWWPEIWETARKLNIEGKGLIDFKE